MVAEASPSVTLDDPELPEAAEQLADFLVGNGMPTAVADIHREHVEAFVADLAQRFRPATVGVRFAAFPRRAVSRPPFPI
jgi:hypothetical protein